MKREPPRSLSGGQIEGVSLCARVLPHVWEEVETKECEHVWVDEMSEGRKARVTSLTVLWGRISSQCAGLLWFYEGGCAEWTAARRP